MLISSVTFSDNFGVNYFFTATERECNTMIERLIAIRFSGCVGGTLTLCDSLVYHSSDDAPCFCYESYRVISLLTVYISQK